jgi:hypothetical protein
MALSGLIYTIYKYVQIRVLNSNIEKLQKQSKESSAKNSQSSERLCSQQINDLIERYKEPEQARQFLMEAGIIDENGDLMPPYQNTST